MRHRENRKIIVFSQSALNYLISALLVLMIASVLIVMQGSNPVAAFLAMADGAVGSRPAIASSIRWSTPVIISAMAAVTAQKSGINNLGIEGQIYFGAFTSAIVGAYVSGPPAVVIPLAIFAGAAAGLFYAVVPALLKIYWNVDEMISTLMLNYIAIQVTEYLTMMIMGLGSDVNPDMIATPEILNNAKLARIMPPYQATAGIFIALGFALIIYVLYRYARIGYEWTMIGRNRRFAGYGGISQIKNYLFIFLVSGAIAGVCGATEILGPHLRFRTNFSTNMGWDGIMVALVARNNPAVAVVVAVIWGMIKAGSMNMERMTSVNRILVTLVQALFVLFITVDFKRVFGKIRKSKRGGMADA